MGIFWVFFRKYWIAAHCLWTGIRKEALLPGKAAALYGKCYAVGGGVSSLFTCDGISSGIDRGL